MKANKSFGVLLFVFFVKALIFSLVAGIFFGGLCGVILWLLSGITVEELKVRSVIMSVFGFVMSFISFTPVLATDLRRYFKFKRKSGGN